MTKPKHDAKKFTYGQVVEVQREPGSEWSPAIYRGKIADWRGWHTVRIDEGRYIDSMSGTETTRENPRALLSFTLILPTKRIRAKKAS